MHDCSRTVPRVSAPFWHALITLLNSMYCTVPCIRPPSHSKLASNEMKPSHQPSFTSFLTFSDASIHDASIGRWKEWGPIKSCKGTWLGLWITPAQWMPPGSYLLLQKPTVFIIDPRVVTKAYTGVEIERQLSRRLCYRMQF